MSASEEVKAMSQAIKGNHPSETDLALLAGGDCGRLQRLLLKRHVSHCGDCRDTLASFSELRSAVKDFAFPGAVSNQQDWDRMAAEMRANIRLGLAAGECVGESPKGVRRNWMPQLAFGMTGVLLLVGAGVFLHGLLPHDSQAIAPAAESVTENGVEVQSDNGGSLALLKHGDGPADQQVTSQGEVQNTSVSGGMVIVARMSNGD